MSELIAQLKSQLAELVSADDSATCCPVCEKRVRNDEKGLNRWQALALQMLVEASLVNGSQAVHAATVIADSPANRDHGVSLLRHWELILAVDRPANAPPEQKGSRGLSGFYVVTQKGYDFVNGLIKIPKRILKPFGSASWLLDTNGVHVSFAEAMDLTLVVNNQNMVLDGTTA